MSSIAPLLILAISILLYFIPFWVALNRKHSSTIAIFILNLALGWTGLGWLLALIWAFANPGHPQQVIVNIQKDQK